jgi:hypothetical protein
MDVSTPVSGYRAIVLRSEVKVQKQRQRVRIHGLHK